MKRMLSRFCLLLAALLLAQLAQAEALDLNAKGTIALEMKSVDGLTVRGGTFWLYRVGDPVIRENSLSFVPTAAFEGSGASLDDLTDSALPGKLYDYILKHPSVNAEDVKEADASGKAKFENVECGLYLVVQKQTANGYERMSPFVVSVPMTNSSGTGWSYDVTARPKVEPVPTYVPETTPEPTPRPSSPSGENLPQTGMLMWPVPVLAGAGIALFAVGWVLCFGRKRHD